MNFDVTRNWHYVANGQAAGPVPGDQLRAMAASGAIRRETKIWSGGMADWADAGSFVDLFPAPPSFTPTPPPHHQPAYAPPPQSYAPPQQSYAPQQPAYGASHYQQPVNSPYMAATGQLHSNGMAQVHYAGFWIRAVALIIDGVILTVISLVLNFALLSVLDIDISTTGAISDADAGAYTALQGFIGLIGLLYFVLLNCSRKQGTWGKQIVGIHLIHANGGKVGFGRSLGRYFAQIVSALIFGIGYLMAGWTDQKKALHDMICDTRVVYGRL
jgi:uncharacterized RDD family membrane protein YckC